MSDSQVIVLILILIIFGLLCYWYIKYKLKHKTETITAYTGGLGSGKTLLSVEKAISIYKKQLRKYKVNFFLNKFRRNKKEIERPLLFSNIPIIIGKTKSKYGKRVIKRNLYCNVLTKEHLLLQEKLPLNSVILLDEIGAFATQFDFKDKNIIDVFNEFVRFYRHYTKGGYMVVNEQCSENINLVVRRRLNTIHNLSNCVVVWRFCFYFERMINISEEIKTIDMKQAESESDTQDNSNLRFKFLWFKGAYDTYCYSERYKRVPIKEFTRFHRKKTNKLLKCPKDKEHIYIPLTEEFEKKGEN